MADSQFFSPAEASNNSGQNSLRLKGKIELKKLAGIDSLSANQLRFILLKSQEILSDLYNQFDHNISLDQGKFPIKNASDNVFKLIKTKELANFAIFPEPKNRSFYLLAADFAGFIEQAYQAFLVMSSSENGFPSQEQKSRLKEIEKLNVFNLLGIEDHQRLSHEDLEKFEDQNNISNEVSNFVQKIFEALDWQEATTTEAEEEAETGLGATVATKESTVPTAAGSSETNDKDSEGVEEREPREEIERKRQELRTDFNSEFNLANLDPQSKFYIQSLAIITVNQALANYFNQGTLDKYGLTTVPSFDQLSLEARRQLLNIAFGKVESLLASGQYNFEDLIKATSSRLNFAREAALDVLLDLNGVRLLTAEVSRIARAQIIPLEELNSELLSERIKVVGQNNITSVQAAEDFFKNSNDDKNSLNSILGSLSNSLSKVDEQTLTEELTKLVLASGRDETGANILIQNNVIPTIKTLIQEGYPVDFLQVFDYSRFIFYFGKDLIDEKTFNQNRQLILSLLGSYWITTRSYWASEVRREVAYERINQNEAVELLNEVVGDEKKLTLYSQQLQKGREINVQYTGSEVVQALAGQSTSDPVLQKYQFEEKERYAEYFKNYFSQKKVGASYEEMEIFIRFYLPQQQFADGQSFSIENYQQAAKGFSVYDLPALNANQTLEYPVFSSAGEGVLNYPTDEEWANTPFIEDLRQKAGSAAGGLAEGLGKKAINYGLRAGLGVITSGGSEAAFKAIEAAKKLPIVGQIIQQLENEALNKIIEFFKKHWPLLVLAALMALLAFLAPILLLAAPVIIVLWRSGLLNSLLGGGKLFGGGSQAAAAPRAAQSIGTAQAETVTPKAVTGQLAETAKTSAATAGQVGSGAMVTAGQAVIGTVGIIAGGAALHTLGLYAAFLTNFPAAVSDFAASVEKTSKYAKMEKTAKIIAGCPNPENNATKCENPNFPVTIEYEIVISPKEDYTITITNITDEIKFKHNTKAWEESEGRTPPSIPSILKTTSDFPELEASDSATIHPGETLVLSYTLEDLDANYNHASITNILEAKFYYSNAINEGTDNMKTAARICLGECSGGVGCWPTTGGLPQLPFGTYSHTPPNSSGYADAYDINNPNLPPVFTPFAGELCFQKCSDSGYGCYYVLKFNDGAEDRKLLFAHFENASSALSQPGACMQVEEGYMIDVMGNRGFSSGPHLHYELDYMGQFYHPAQRSSSILETLVPETDQGNYPPVLGNTVTTCYQ